MGLRLYIESGRITEAASKPLPRRASKRRLRVALATALLFVLVLAAIVYASPGIRPRPSGPSQPDRTSHVHGSAGAQHGHASVTV
jgi:hypothetical protein